MLAGIFGIERVVPGSTTVGSKTLAPGVIHMTRGTADGDSTTYMGAPRDGRGIPARLREIARALSESRLPAEALESADEVLWTKLAMASMAPMTAIMRRTIKDVVDDPRSFATVRGMFDEAVNVAHALGVRLDRDAAWEHSTNTWRLVGHSATSMAFDVANRRPTEIDAMALEVARLGEEYGVPTPLTRAVGGLVKAMERSYERTVEGDPRPAP